MTKHYRQALLLAHAAWTELEAAAKAFQAGMLRGDAEEAEVARRRAHDLLDAHLDQHAAAALAVRDLLDR